MGVDSLLATHMSCYGYHRLTTPHMDRFAQGGTLFERTYSPYVPTTSAYASMLTGMDVFSTQVVALRHKGPLSPKSKHSPKSFERQVTIQPASVSVATPVHGGLITIWTTQVGVVGRRDRARKPRTSMRSRFPNLTASSIGMGPSSCSCDTWMRIPPICPRPLTSGCSTTATNAIWGTSRWSR